MKLLLSISLTVVIAGVGACKNDQEAVEPTANTAPTDQSQGDPAPADQQQMQPAQRAQELWQAVGEEYATWPSPTQSPVAGEEPHGAFIRTYYNQDVAQAIGGEGNWPTGSIIVKENYMANAAGDGAGNMAAITVMQRLADGWFWAKFDPGGEIATQDGAPVAGGSQTACASCHGAAATRDFVITELAANQ